MSLSFAPITAPTDPGIPSSAATTMVCQWHEFIRAARESEPDVRRLLKEIDGQIQRHNNEGIHLAGDSELVDALCRAVAATRLPDVAGHIRNSIRRHGTLDHLQTLMECAAIISGRGPDTLDTLNTIQAIHNQVKSLIHGE